MGRSLNHAFQAVAGALVLAVFQIEQPEGLLQADMIGVRFQPLLALLDAMRALAFIGGGVQGQQFIVGVAREVALEQAGGTSSAPQAGSTPRVGGNQFPALAELARQLFPARFEAIDVEACIQLALGGQRGQLGSPVAVDHTGPAQGRCEQAQVAPATQLLIVLQQKAQYALVAGLAQVQFLEYGGRFLGSSLGCHKARSRQAGDEMASPEAAIGVLEPAVATGLVAASLSRAGGGQVAGGRVAMAQGLLQRSLGALPVALGQGQETLLELSPRATLAGLANEL